MFDVIYYSRGGNTKKLATAIAAELGVSPQNVKDVKELPQHSLILLGSGCYGGRPASEMVRFIEKNDFKGMRVALFGTSASGEGKETDAMEKLLKGKECRILGKFCCTGKFLLSNKGHPSDEELDKARYFAQRMKKAIV